MRYLHETLGFEVWPYQYEGGVHFDPHGLNDGVNAWYTSGGYIAFGSPPSNVDAGEANDALKVNKDDNQMNSTNANTFPNNDITSFKPLARVASGNCRYGCGEPRSVEH